LIFDAGKQTGEKGVFHGSHAAGRVENGERDE